MRDHLAWPLRRGIAVAVMQRSPSLLFRLVSRLVDSALNCTLKDGNYRHMSVARCKAMNIVISLIIANYQKAPMLVSRRWPQIHVWSIHVWSGPWERNTALHMAI